MEGTGFASCPFFCGVERGVNVENLGEEVVEVVHELVFDLGNVGDGGLAEDQGRVVVVGPCVLYEQQAGAHVFFTDSVISFKNVLARRSSSCGMFFERNNTVFRLVQKRFLFNQAGVEDGLEVVVTVVFDVGGVENRCDIGQGLQTGAAGFVIDNTYAVACRMDKEVPEK